MKRFTIILLIMLFVFTHVYAQSISVTEKKEKRTERRPFTETVTKTYILKHISPSVVCNVLSPYILQKSYSNAKRMLSVVLLEKNKKIFEEILKKMDVKKKDIKLVIYTIIGKKTDSSKIKPIKNKKLKSVLNKLNDLMNFKTFSLDGVSFLPLKDGQKRSNLKLSSNNNDLRISVVDVQIMAENKKLREVKFSFQFRDSVLGNLINTETSVKENGYLVAGVSKIGKNGDSLILVISAEIGK